MPLKPKSEEELESIIRLIKLKYLTTLGMIQTWKTEMITPCLAIIAIYIEQLNLDAVKANMFSENSFINQNFLKCVICEPVRLQKCIQNSPKLLAENKIKIGQIKFAQFLIKDIPIGAFSSKTPLNQIMSFFIEFVQKLTRFYFSNCINSTGDDFSFVIYFSKQMNNKFSDVQFEKDFGEKYQIKSEKGGQILHQLEKLSKKQKESENEGKMLIKDEMNNPNSALLLSNTSKNDQSKKNMESFKGQNKEDSTIDQKIDDSEKMSKKSEFEEEKTTTALLKNDQIEKKLNFDRLNFSKNQNINKTSSHDLKCDEIVFLNDFKSENDQNTKTNQKSKDELLKKSHEKKVISQIEPIKVKPARFRSFHKAQKLIIDKSTLNNVKCLPKTNTFIKNHSSNGNTIDGSNRKNDHHLTELKKSKQEDQRVLKTENIPDRLEDKSLTPVNNKLRDSINFKLKNENVQPKIINFEIFKNETSDKNKPRRTQNDNKSMSHQTKGNKNNRYSVRKIQKSIEKVREKSLNDKKVEINKDKVKFDEKVSFLENKLENKPSIPKLENVSLNNHIEKAISNEKKSKKIEKRIIINPLEDLDLKTNLSHFIKSEVKKLKASFIKNGSNKTVLTKSVANNFKNQQNRMSHSVRQGFRLDHYRTEDRRSLSMSKFEYTSLSNFRKNDKKRIFSHFDAKKQSQPKTLNCEKKCGEVLQKKQELSKKLVESIYRKNAKSSVKEYIETVGKTPSFRCPNLQSLEQNQKAILAEKKRLNELVLEKKRILFQIDKEATDEFKKNQENIEDTIKYNEEYVKLKVES